MFQTSLQKKGTMLLQRYTNQKTNQSQTRKYVFAPLSLICDKNITHKERSLMLAHFVYAKKSSCASFRFVKVETLALKYSDFGSKTPSKALLKGLKSLHEKGYIRLIDGKYALIVDEKFKESAFIALDAIPFYNRNVKVGLFGLLAFLNHRKENAINCVNFIAKELGLDRKTVDTYLKTLQKLNLVDPYPILINGKLTQNYHLKSIAVFYTKPKRHKAVNNSITNSVDDECQNSTHIDNNYLIIIKHMWHTAKNLDFRKYKKMFTIRDFIDSKKHTRSRIYECIRANLYFKNKLVTPEEIEAKLTDIFLDLEKDGIVKVFNHTSQLINFAGSLFKTTSYPLEKGLNDVILLKDIQSTVKREKGELYSIPFIKWLATKLFSPDFRIYHVNVFKNRMIEALNNEKRSGEETTYWKDEQYTDWDEIHASEKKKYINQIF